MGAGGASLVDASLVDASLDEQPAADSGPEVSPMVLPVALYSFDQTSGTVINDLAGNGHDGTLIGGATFGAGIIGNDLSLSGTNQYGTLPMHMLDNATELTIACWVKVRVDRTWARVLDFGDNSTVYMFLTPHASTTNGVRFAITKNGASGEQRLDGTTTLPAGTWKHLAVVLGAAGGTLYVDGAAVANDAALTLRPADLGATVNNWIGRSEFTVDPYLDGEIDELRIYDNALSAAEIAAIFNLR